jgi:hypothetical protein
MCSSHYLIRKDPETSRSAPWPQGEQAQRSVGPRCRLRVIIRLAHASKPRTELLHSSAGHKRTRTEGDALAA